MIIYCITNLVNGKKYVGQTVQTLHGRWSHHVSDARRNNRSCIQRAICKYGPTAFRIEIVANCSSYAEMDEHERAIIASMGTCDRNRGYNLTDGGEGKGKEFTEEYRKRLSESHKGKAPWNKGMVTGPLSEEHRKKIGEAHL